MDITQLFKIAASTAGIGGIAILIFWLIYKDILHLGIFSKLTRKNTYQILMIIIILSFSAFVIGIATYVFGRPAGKSYLNNADVYQIVEVDPYEGNEFSLNAGERQGIAQGDMLALLGKPASSLQGEELGRRTIGWIEVLETGKNVSFARLRKLDRDQTIAPGTLVEKRTPPADLPPLPPKTLFGQITSVRSGAENYLIDIGSVNGISIFTRFAVFGDPVTKLDFSGSSLGREKIGELLITETEQHWSKGILVSGNKEPVAVGSMVRYLSVADSAEAEAMIRASKKTEISITSVPDGADLYLSGNYVGKTPDKQFLARGKYLIKIEKTGYKSLIDSLTVSAHSGNMSYKLTPLKQTRYEINIWSYPDGAEVYIRGQFQGLSPLKVKLPPGRHEILVKLTDYEEKRDVIVVPDMRNYTTDLKKIRQP